MDCLYSPIFGLVRASGRTGWAVGSIIRILDPSLHQECDPDPPPESIVRVHCFGNDLVSSSRPRLSASMPMIFVCVTGGIPGMDWSKAYGIEIGVDAAIAVENEIAHDVCMEQ